MRKWILTAFILLPILLGSAGKLLVIQSQLSHADCIAVLSGNDDIRLTEAAKLYQDGISESIILTNTGKYYDEYYISHNQYQKEKLQKMGVPEGALFLVDFVAKNTGQEATSIKNKMYELGAKSVIIVTDPWHTRRVSLIFKDSFKNTDFHVQYHAAANDGFHPFLWFLSMRSWREVTGEYLRIMGFFIKKYSNIPDYPIFKFLQP